MLKKVYVYSDLATSDCVVVEVEEGLDDDISPTLPYMTLYTLVGIGFWILYTYDCP